jgi:hypothetical protein
MQFRFAWAQPTDKASWTKLFQPTVLDQRLRNPEQGVDGQELCIPWLANRKRYYGLITNTGAFGHVFKVQHKKTGAFRAFKVISNIRNGTDQAREIQNELTILKKLVQTHF